MRLKPRDLWGSTIKLSGAGCEEAGEVSIQVQMCERAVAFVVVVLLSFCLTFEMDRVSYPLTQLALEHILRYRLRSDILHDALLQRWDAL